MEEWTQKCIKSQANIQAAWLKVVEGEKTRIGEKGFLEKWSETALRMLPERAR
jgi:hypothetical protein